VVDRVEVGEGAVGGAGVGPAGEDVTPALGQLVVPAGGRVAGRAERPRQLAQSVRSGRHEPDSGDQR
jgi:hypothetical protein